MSERLEQWKAREKVRSDIGWAAVLIGVWGLLAIAFSVAELLGSEKIHTTLPPILSLLIGLALGACAVGLWNVQSWARWTAAFLFSAQSLFALWSLNICLLPFVLFAAVYLFLPSTDRHFARVRGLRRGNTATPRDS